MFVRLTVALLGGLTVLWVSDLLTAHTVPLFGSFTPGQGTFLTLPRLSGSVLAGLGLGLAIHLIGAPIGLLRHRPAFFLLSAGANLGCSRCVVLRLRRGVRLLDLRRAMVVLRLLLRRGKSGSGDQHQRSDAGKQCVPLVPCVVLFVLDVTLFRTKAAPQSKTQPPRQSFGSIPVRWFDVIVRDAAFAPTK